MTCQTPRIDVVDHVVEVSCAGSQCISRLVTPQVEIYTFSKILPRERSIIGVFGLQRCAALKCTCSSATRALLNPFARVETILAQEFHP
jgi:hypothetical protein